MWFIRHPIPLIGTAGVFVLGWLVIKLEQKFISSRTSGPKDEYRKQRLLSTIIVVVGGVIIVALWSRLFQHTSTFLGLIGAGLAVALREPLLSIAGRIAIFVGRMYTAGDRIEINKMSGDVIDVGFFYTRMMETGSAATSTADASFNLPTPRYLARQFSITLATSPISGTKSSSPSPMPAISRRPWTC